MGYWQTTKLLGTPNGAGWANENIHLIDAIIAFESESNKMEMEEAERREKKMKREKGSPKRKR